MASRDYENFDLLVESMEDGTYRSRVTASPVGVGASATFPMPFNATELENLLLKLDPGRSQMRRATSDPRPQASTDLGGRLFDAVFGDEVLLAWSRSLDSTRSGGKGLRVRLQLTDAPALAGLPWELLWDKRPHTFVAQSERTPVVRYLEVSQPPRPLVVDGPLRVLVVLSSPTDLPELDVEAEWRRLQDGLADRVAVGLVHLDRLLAPTTAALSAWLRDHDVHILHVIGHGDYDEQQQEGVLYFCDAYGRSVAVSPAILGPYLHDHDPLRLVFLNACQSGRLGAADPFSGMAQRLVQQDCTAVVAMQFPISDGAATAFTGEFYAALADGMPVDQSVTSARKALLAGYASEWATPVLYLNAPDGQVFASITTTPAAPAAPAASPPVVLQTAPDSGSIPHEPAPPPPPPPPPATTTTTRTPRVRLVSVAVALAVAVLVAAAVAVAVSRGGGTSSSGPQPAAAASVAATSASPATATAAPGVSALTKSAGSVTASATLRPVEGPAIGARALATPPTIDGKGDDWPALTPVIADQLVVGTTASVKGVWSLGWDADNLYLLADVVDPEASRSNADRPAQLFKGDGVTLQFGAPEAPVDGISLTPGDVSLALAPTGDGRTVAAMTLASGSRFDVDAGRAVPGITAASATTPTGYTLEASVPWSVFQQPDAPGLLSTKFAGATFGLNLLVEDADPSTSSTTGIRSRVSNNRYVADHTVNDGSYRRYWGSLTLQG